MAIPKHIFISYSHNNSAQMMALKSALEATGEYEVRCDVGDENLVEELHRKISNNLNWADIVLPIVTKFWLESHECRDELVRAHERRKRIVLFRQQDITNDGPPRVPYFMHEMLHVTWDDRSLARSIYELIEKMKSIQMELWKYDSFRSLRSIGDYIQSAEHLPRWKSLLVRRLLEKDKGQLKQIITTDSCSFDVSHENSYLAFADSMFRSAEDIIAVCIASISTFWTNPDFRSPASSYLSHQKEGAKSIKRLFVFASPEEANEYKNILQAHYNSYAKREGSGVFLCTSAAYEKLSTRWNPASSHNHLKQDFGLLKFSDSERDMEAVLDPKEFRYREFGSEEPTETRNKLITEHFESFISLPEGEIDSKSGIAKWATFLWEDPSAFAKLLEDLFGKRRGKVTHSVIVRASSSDEKVSSFVYSLAKRFYERKIELKILDVTVHRYLATKVEDGRFGGKIVVDPEFDYCIQFTFLDREALNHYYEHELHSIEREQLYCMLNPKICKEFEALHAIPVNQDRKRAAQFEKIERMMMKGGFVHRNDTLDDEPILNVVSRRGTPFADCDH